MITTKIKISSTTSAKTTKVTLKIHARNTERLNIYRSPDNFFLMAS